MLKLPNNSKMQWNMIMGTNPAKTGIHTKHVTTVYITYPNCKP